ncbi:5-formyltetrahydrofolate cyclo-ligase [Pikeienuella piscinae]|uniref:5-formyltetrahydrofolate cyclo-ligase n=1 Tax=Pikeienuella piscinae TaxID=2748098 RepID=A0A7L5BWP7_9RHOB|nr:5-formyltetrahydrofolate cyclo-ligase [Pikeienuella piscinae]QIE54676.1 5-formyltetrahydrofolate cyclo-ligase [Pikeienuella piscinae]
MIGLAEEKTALRREISARRKAAHEARDRRDPAANARLLALIGDAAGRVVAGYRPIRSEIDPTAAMTALHEAGARVAAPVIAETATPLRFREWTPCAAMTEGPFGAMIPESGDWLEPEILVVPLLGWDRAGGRLGYGGGFYDRTLAALRAGKGARAIGFAYAAQEIAAAPAGPFDQRLDAVVTENEVVRITI